MTTVMRNSLKLWIRMVRKSIQKEDMWPWENTMANWGWREHKLEAYSSSMLFIGLIFSLLYMYYRISWIPLLLCLWVILTFVVHFIARFCHWRERVNFRKR